MKTNKVLVVILASLPVAYVGLMKATQQPVEWWVVLVMLPFMAFPFVVGRPLAKLTVEEQDKLVRQVAPVFLAAATGHVLVPRPPQNESLRSKLVSRAVVGGVGAGIWLWGDKWRVNEMPAPYVGLAVMAVCAVGAAWAIVKWFRERGEHVVRTPDDPTPPRPRE